MPREDDVWLSENQEDPASHIHLPDSVDADRSPPGIAPALGSSASPPSREQSGGEGHRQNPLWLRSRTPSRMGVA